MKKIKLPKGEWFYDPNKLLGPEGGFGIVFDGQSSAGEVLAVKRLKIVANEAAHRELRIAQELSRQDFKNIIPCFDAGQDAESDHYFVVMANTIVLGSGSMELVIGTTNSVPWDCFKRSGWDVVAAAKIVVSQTDKRNAISSSLFYAKRRGENEYRWWEIGFNFSMFSDKRYLYHIAMDVSEHVDIALAQQSIGQYAVQYGPKAIDDEDSEAFCLKWADLLAKASSGAL